MEDKRKKLYDDEDVDSILARYGISDDALTESSEDLSDVDRLLSQLLEDGEEAPDAPAEEEPMPEENVPEELPKRRKKAFGGDFIKKITVQKKERGAGKELPAEESSTDGEEAERPFQIEDVVASTVSSVLEERKEDERRYRKQAKKAKKEHERIHRSNAERAEDRVEFPDEEPSLVEAAVRQKHRYRAMRRHAIAATVLTVLSWMPALLRQFGITIPYYADDVRIYVAVTAALQLGVCIAAWPVLFKGFGRREVNGCTLAALGGLVTLLDAATMLLFPERFDVEPLTAVSAVALTLALWGEYWHAGALRESFRLVALGDPSYVVDLTGHGAVKQRGKANGFYHRCVKEEASERWETLLLPVVLVASFVFAALATFGLHRQDSFIWCWSAILTAGSALALPCVYSLPYYRLAKRLGKSGCAVAGLYGAWQLSFSKEMLVDDTDLFPAGTIRMKDIKIISEDKRKVASYAGSLAMAYGSGWGDLFLRFFNDAGGRRENLDHYHVHAEGGVSASIRGETAILGTATLLRRLSVHLPKSVEWKDGLYLAIDGELVAIFCLVYKPADSVRWALGSMRRNAITPLLATRDPNITNRFLKNTFGLDGGAHLLDLNERLNLSQLRHVGEARPNALLYREGLAPYFEAVAGSKRLCRAARWSTIISLFGSMAGTLLTFYLTFMGSVRVLSPVQLLVFLGLWLLPVLVLSHNVDKI